MSDPLDRRDPYWSREQKRIVDTLTAAFNALSGAEKKRVASIEDAFFEWLRGNERADPRPFIEWARSVDPSAFARPRLPEPTLLHPPGALAIDPLPDWWPEMRAYHGSRASWQIENEGLCAPTAEYASGDPEYGWSAVWKDELYQSYRHHLTAEQRRKFNALFGENARPFPKDTFGELVSLLWVTKNIEEAESYGDVYEVDLSKLNYYWWFPDEIAGKGAYVFVMPTDCPQALPSAFKRVTARRGNARASTRAPSETWYHLTDRARFKLDPRFEPLDNAFAIEDRSGVPGIDLGKSVEQWVNGYGYWRPFVVELRVDPSVKNDPGVHGRYGGEMFVPASSVNKLTVERVIPLDAYAREEFGEPGWIESELGVAFDTGEPPLTSYRGYRYPGPDVRTMPPFEVARLKRELRQVKGVGRRRDSDCQRSTAQLGSRSHTHPRRPPRALQRRWTVRD